MRILLIVGRDPWPPRRGDQLRALELAEILATRHEVTLLAPEPAGWPDWQRGGASERLPSVQVERYQPPSATAKMAGLAHSVFGRRPLQGALFRSPDLERRAAELARRSDLAILQLVRLEAVRPVLGDLPVFVDLIDSLSLNFARRARRDRLWLRPLLALEARRLLAAERRLIDGAAGAWVVSERDRRHLAERLPGSLTSKIDVLPLSVEAPLELPPDRLQPVVALTGNLGYFVNHDAVRWWLDKVYPSLAARRRNLRVVVAGARPPGSLVRACRRAGVELIASPPDLRAVLAGAAVASAPMQCGSGMPIKILEAWALGVPVVATPWAAAGTTGVAGEDFLVAESPEEWAEATLRLLDDRDLRQKLRANAHRRLRADYGRQATAKRLLEQVSRLPH